MASENIQGLLQDGETANDQHDGEEVVPCFHASCGPLVLSWRWLFLPCPAKGQLSKVAVAVSHVSGTDEPENHLFLASRVNPEGF